MNPPYRSPPPSPSTLRALPADDRLRLMYAAAATPARVVYPVFFVVGGIGLLNLAAVFTSPMDLLMRLFALVYGLVLTLLGATPLLTRLALRRQRAQLRAAGFEVADDLLTARGRIPRTTVTR